MESPENEMHNFYNLLGHTKETEVRTISDDGVRSYFVNNEKSFVELCLSLDGKTNVYAGIHERKTRGTTEKEVESIHLLPFDFDPIRPPHSAATPNSLKEAFTSVANFWNNVVSDFQR